MNLLKYKGTMSSEFLLHEIYHRSKHFGARSGSNIWFKDILSKEALAWYGKLTWESAHAWMLKILCYLIDWDTTLIFMVRLSFYAIPLLIYDVMNDITIIP